MKKRLFCLICALLIVTSAFGITAAAENTDGADKIYTLFDMCGGFIVENPIDTSGTTNKPWLLIGKDVFMTDNGGYPAEFDNPNDNPSFYHIAGSNRGDQSYNDCLKNDFVVEYVVDYDESAHGSVSIAIAYNYEYYIEAYVSADGSGDIVIVAGENRVSMLDGKSLLDSESGAALVSALCGEGGEIPERLAISIKVSVGEDGMPDEVDIYVNGLLAGNTGVSFAESVDNLAPEYKPEDNGVIPQNKLGNIIALKISEGARGSINSIFVYATDENATSPNADAQKYYAEVYGNASYTQSIAESSVDNADDDDYEFIDYDIITNIALTLGISAASIIVIAFIILILRNKIK